MKSSDLILKVTAKTVFFIIMMFAIHLFFEGHYRPGGGFVGGLVTAGALVLLLLAFDMKTIANSLPIDFKWVIGIGLLISVVTAAGALLFDVPFFTHTYDYFYLPLLGKTSLHTAALFDLGVYLVVVGATMTIIQTLGESE
ncbi:Na(+)/H(+) antiporter subunit B [Caldibacillus thermolactis]|jgi:multicomponent Na+:H+ antiporter subunit B|uniref:Na(+)/H(+) antiporter subunit B n=1 Tax=Pallidibacillus thermolactis TaxID=251051 RepID=A0ABT2WIS1_9BACI|nr:Na(+)/H(+) antiporter subunit B [Pallidibacillus thermolactis]MCU9595578.1 Na(+)/H(+) antiporter subunit B [Pallidibacillus thermolactis]MCU9600950.1 Na(+)/H(+) antiporter subunit B [Pallidibacillus thermolactis subsp. kokeshiiformis]MED1674386.1 Na(+)/H(+) antiporter subunit B [Pallidibacillus thermolactis subsp. kokeshiiformis]